MSAKSYPHHTDQICNSENCNAAGGRDWTGRILLVLRTWPDLSLAWYHCRCAISCAEFEPAGVRIEEGSEAQRSGWAVQTEEDTRGWSSTPQELQVGPRPHLLDRIRSTHLTFMAD
jgi:hypothetical protein